MLDGEPSVAVFWSKNGSVEWDGCFLRRCCKRFLLKVFMVFVEVLVWTDPIVVLLDNIFLTIQIQSLDHGVPVS